MHEDADLCMLKHEDVENIVNGESVIAKDSIWNVIDETENDDGGNEPIEDNLEMTFQIPSASKEITIQQKLKKGAKF